MILCRKLETVPIGHRIRKVNQCTEIHLQDSSFLSVFSENPKKKDRRIWFCVLTNKKVVHKYSYDALSFCLF